MAQPYPTEESRLLAPVHPFELIVGWRVQTLNMIVFIQPFFFLLKY